MTRHRLVREIEDSNSWVLTTRLTMAENRRPAVVRCTGVDTRKQPVKQQVYVLDVTWSDGLKSQTEVDDSSLADWRSRFSSQCYKDRTDVTVPELPVKRLEINILAKKDEKRRKAVDEFFQQIMELPDVQNKYQLISELLQPKMPLGENADVTEATLLYADLDFAEFEAARREATMASENIAKKRRPKSDAIYTEVMPTMTQKSACFRLPDVVEEEDDMYAKVTSADNDKCLKASQIDSHPDTVKSKAAGHDPRSNYTKVQRKAPAAAISNNETPVTVSKIPTKTNIQIPTYENVQPQETSANPAVNEFFVATESYEPSSSSNSRQELSVSAGDIIMKSFESDNGVFGVLCAKTPTVVLTKAVEGWLPLNVLTPCNPEVIEDSRSAVPVVRMDSTPMYHQYVNGRYAGAVESAADTKETAPDAHMIGSCANDEGNGKLPAMPTCNSPTLLTAPQLPPQLNEVYATQRGGKFGKLLKPKVAAKPSPPPKDRVAGEDNGLARTIRVVAVADWHGATGAMAFACGDCGELVYAGDRDWMCVRMREQTGWVPADYWRIVIDDGRVGGLTTSVAAPWMAGKLTRAACERIMLKNGKERDFVIRSSPHLTSQYVLSVRHADRVHHFPIVLTESGKFFIGNHHFSSLHNVIIYYSKHVLFTDDNKVSVTLGRPLHIDS